MALNIGRVIKDADDTRKETINWAPSLREGSTISTATAIAPSGITVSATTNDETTVTHTIEGGTIGQEYDITSRIETSDGEQLDLEFTVVVV